MPYYEDPSVSVTVAEYLAAALAGAGVRHVFGYPGGATVELAEQLRRLDVEFVSARSESAAGYMAAAYGDRTQRPGVVIATLGPGATNLVNATAHALLDRSPLLVITGREGALADGLSHQRLNQTSLFEPVTKWSSTAVPGSFPRQLQQAWRLAVAERPGPVHLDLPIDLVGSAVDQPGPSDALPEVPCHSYGPAPDITAAVSALHSARRPVALVGYSAVRGQAHEALRHFAEAWRVPVVTTAKAKGALPENHPLWAGVTDMTGRNFVNSFVATADLRLAIGFDTVEVITHPVFGSPVVHVDLLPNTRETYASGIELLGDVATTLDGLAVAAERPVPSLWSDAELSSHRESMLRLLTLPGPGLSPSALATAARQALPDDVVVVTDVGAHKLMLGTLWPVYRPNTFMVSNGLGTMGFGLPAAIAVQLASRGQRAVCFTGDGGFAMASAELSTAVSLRLGIIVVVFNDGALEHIRLKQDVKGYPNVGTVLSNPDIVALAEAHGAVGATASSADELASHLDKLLAADVTAVIDARLDPAEYAVQFEA
jgi:acetolactate synthase I/II/III large subunit